MKNADILEDKLQMVKLLVKDLKVPRERDGIYNYRCWEEGYSPARLERQLMELRALLGDLLRICRE